MADAAAAREPHRLTTYLTELAGEFQSYYTRLQKVHGDTILPQERHRTGDWRATLELAQDGGPALLGRRHRPGDPQRAGAAGRVRPRAMARATDSAAEDPSGTKEDDS